MTDNAHVEPLKQRHPGPSLFGRLSITTKVTAALLLVSLVPIVLVAYFNLLGSTNTVAESEQENMKLVAGSIAGRLDQLVAGVRGSVHFIAMDPETIGFLGDDAADVKSHAPAVEELLKRVVEGDENIVTAYLMNRDGVFTASTNPKVVGRDFRFRDYFNVPMQGGDFTSDLLVGLTSGESGVYFSSPVRDGAGRTLGVAVVKVRGEAVTEIMDAVNELAGHAKAFLVNPEGIIIYHPKKTLVYRSLTTLTEAEITEIQAAKRFPVPTIQSLHQPAVKEAMLSAKQPGYTRYLASPRDPAVLGYAPLKHHYWVVGVEKPESAFAEPLNRLFQQVLYSVALIGTIVVGIALLLSQAIVRPIRGLTRAASHLGKAHEEGRQELAAGEESGFRLNTNYKVELEAFASRYHDEIGILAGSFNNAETRLHEYFEELKSVTAAKERIESEMKIAALIQKSFLPEPFSAGERRRAVELFVVIEPAKEVGGDLYDYFFLDDEHLFFAVGDVSDKGIPAGLFMGVTLALLRNIATTDRTPSRILAELNLALSRKNDACQFVTMFCGILHLPTGLVHYSHAGHNHPYVISPAKGSIRPLVPVIGTALGVFEDDTYKTETLQLEPGDRMFLYTDGVTEAMDVDDKLYGEARLESCLAATAESDCPKDVVDRVMVDVARHAAGAAQSDDITAMCIEFRTMSSQG